MTKEQVDYYWKSRKGKDRAGNNSLHSVFETNFDSNDERNRFLRILLDEGIGEV